MRVSRNRIRNLNEDTKMRIRKALALGIGLLLIACADEENGPTDVVVDVPATYAFASLAGGDSGVSKSGQVFRHVLIAELKGHISGLSESIDSGEFTPTDDGDVVSSLDFYFRFDSDSNGGESLRAFDGALQTTFDDVSSGKDLVGKLAGNDTATDHMDWSSEFGGWSDAAIAAEGGSITSPEGLVIAFFETIEANAIGRSNGEVRNGPDGEQLPVYLTETGLDLNQLTQKFLLMAIGFSQGADDYLDDDTEGKGLLASNVWDGESDYTDLAHAWDEGFGYFGASIDFGSRDDQSVADSAAFDTNGDGAIDLLTEFTFGNAVNASKRDLGATVATDFSQLAFDAFLEGRALIQAVGGDLSDEQLDDLRASRDQAVSNWEAAVAATVVHYINDVLADMDAVGTDDYSFVDHAKHWSELKGFALGFQFNPRSALSDSDFATFHQLVGDAPVLDSAALDAYASDLIDARNLLEDAYGFAPENAQGW